MVYYSIPYIWVLSRAIGHFSAKIYMALAFITLMIIRCYVSNLAGMLLF